MHTLEATYCINTALTSVYTYAAGLAGEQLFSLFIRLLGGSIPVVITLISNTALV